MDNRYRLNFERTHTQRKDGLDCIDNSCGEQIHNESKKLPGHEERIAQEMWQVHKVIGPCSKCHCDICDDYRKRKTYGKEHETHSCRCPACQVRRAKVKAALEFAEATKKALIAAEPKTKRDRREYLRKYHLRKKKAPTKQG